MNSGNRILALIVFSQFCCTSLWFAGNGVLSDLIEYFNLTPAVLGHITSAVQLGFITGTLIFAFLTISDRFSPSKVFFFCSLAGALFNLATILENNNLLSLLSFRFITGFFLAGIYPVGMKIAADYFDKSLGKSLGYLVGALVIGTAFPHLLKEFTGILPWKTVLMATSSLAVFGGILMLLFVPDGPFRKQSQKLNLSAVFDIFKSSELRSAAFGYFGHMWELYAFWAFVPVIITTYNSINPAAMLNVPMLSFFIIGIGGLGCVTGGYLSMTLGSKKVATTALFLSGICCIASPLIFSIESKYLFAGFLLFWGFVVQPDSPQFSTLVAQNASPETKGTALTIVNCLGFSITIFSIQLLNILRETMDLRFIYLFLALGPVLGLLALRKTEHRA